MPVVKHAQAQKIAQDAIVLDLGDLQRQADALKRHALEQAEAIKQDAREERERLIEGARELGYQEGHAAGFMQGHEAGKAEGRAEALEQHSGELTELEQQWGGMLVQFDQSREGLLADAREDMIRLAVEIAQRVTRRSVLLDEDRVQPLLEAALALVLEPTKLVVRVSEEDVASAQEALPRLLQMLGGGAHADVVADAQLPVGSCVVRTERGSIDAGIEGQLEKIVQAMVPDDSLASQQAASSEDEAQGDAMPEGDSA